MKDALFRSLFVATVATLLHLAVYGATLKVGGTFVGMFVGTFIYWSIKEARTRD